MLKPIRTNFGKYTISIYNDEIGIRNYLVRHFEKHLTDTLPDIKVLLSLDTHISPDYFKPGTRYKYLVQNESFDFGPGLIQGTWDSTTRTCKIKAAAFLFTQDYVWLFDRYLCRLFYTMSINEKNPDQQEIIVHCTGVARKGKGYIFFGPPGSGKSTVASFSEKDEVLHDDMNIISMDNDEILLQGVPFNPKLIERGCGCEPLSMILSLNQSEVTSIESLLPAAALRKLVAETMLPQTVIDRDNHKPFEYLLGALKKLCTAVPCYDLYFKKDASFWDEIKKMESNNGKN